MYARTLIVVFVTGLALGAGAGYRVSDTAWEAKSAEAEASARAAEKLYETRLAEAVSERDGALAAVRGVRDSAKRLRQQAEARAANSLPGASGGACDHLAERLSKCEHLLGEGADLAGEGAELSVRVAADHDVLAELLTASERKE